MRCSRSKEIRASSHPFGSSRAWNVSTNLISQPALESSSPKKCGNFMAMGSPDDLRATQTRAICSDHAGIFRAAGVFYRGRFSAVGHASSPPLLDGWGSCRLLWPALGNHRFLGRERRTLRSDSSRRTLAGSVQSGARSPCLHLHLSRGTLDDFFL